MFVTMLVLALVQKPQQPPPQPPAKPEIKVNAEAPPAPAPAKVLAAVDGVPIKAADIEPLLWDWRGYEALQDVLSYRLAVRAAEKAMVSVPEEEVDSMLKRQLEQVSRQAPNARSMDDWLRQQGFPQSRLRMRVKSELLLNKIALLEFKPENYAKLSALTFHPESEMTPALEGAIKRADDAYAKLKAGTAWDIVLAGSESNAAILKARGSIGWQNLSSLPASVVKELASIKPGEYTRPAQTSQGIQVFKLDQRGSDAKDTDLESLKTSFLQATVPGLANKLRATMKIERFYP